MENSIFHIIEHRKPNTTGGPTGSWEQTYATFEQALLAMFSRSYRSGKDIGAGRSHRNLYVSVQDAQSNVLASIITDKSDIIRLQIMSGHPYLSTIRSLLNETEFGRNGQLYDGTSSDVIIGRLGNWGRVNPFFDKMVSLLIRDILRKETPAFPFVVQCLHPEGRPPLSSSDTYRCEYAYFTSSQAAWQYMGLKVREISKDPLSLINPYQQLVMLKETGDVGQELASWSRGEETATILKQVDQFRTKSTRLKSEKPDDGGCSLHFRSMQIDYIDNEFLFPPRDRIHSIYFFPIVDQAITTLMAIDKESLQYQAAWVHRLAQSHERVWIENSHGREVAEIGLKGQLQLLHKIPGFEDVYMPPACFMGIDPSLTTKMKNTEAANILQSMPWQLIGHIKDCQCTQVHQYLFDQISLIGCYQQANDHHLALNVGAYELHPSYIFIDGSSTQKTNPIPVDRLSDATAFMADLTIMPFQPTPEGMRLDHLSIIEKARNIELARADYDQHGVTTKITIQTDRLPAYAIDHFLAMDVPLKAIDNSMTTFHPSKVKKKTGISKRKPGSEGTSKRF